MKKWLVSVVIMLCILALFSCKSEIAENGDTPVKVYTDGGLSDVDKNKADKFEECDFSVQYIRTNGYHDGVRYPIVTVIHSTEELNAYYEANKDKYSLERRTGTIYSDSTIGFLDACDKYDEKYFENQILLMILLEEGSGSIRHEVGSVSLDAGKLVVEINSIVPEVCTDDMAEWHILIEPEASVNVKDKDAVTVFIDGRDTTEKITEVYYEKDSFIQKAGEIEKYSKNHLETAITQYDLNSESYIVYEQWDALLSELYQYLEKVLPESEFKQLQEDELNWIIEKENAIAEAGEKWKGGSGEPMARNMTAIHYTEQRFYYLISLLA